MTDNTVSPDKLTKMGNLGFLFDIIGLVLVILTYVFCYVLPQFGIIPVIPALNIVLLILGAAVLVAAFALETVSSLRGKEKTWKLIVGMVIWILAGASLVVLARILLF